MNMKNFLKGAFAVAALAGAQVFAQDAAPEVKAEEKSVLIPSISLSLDYKSRYISDGFVVNPDNMLFGSLDLGWEFGNFGGLYVGIWGANDLNRYNSGDGIKYEPEEFDYYIGYWYEFSFGNDAVVKALGFDLSYTYWDYPSRTGWEYPGSQQHTFALDIYAPLNFGDAFDMKPGVVVNWDPEDEKLYFKLYAKFSKDFEDIKGLNFSTGVALFWGNRQYVAGKGVKKFVNGELVQKVVDDELVDESYDDEPAITTLNWDVALTYALNDHISFGPFASLSFAADKCVRDTWKLNDNSKSGCNTLWGFGGKISF